jgi:AraC-like DNA-binding protein
VPLTCEPEKLPAFFSRQVRKARRFWLDLPLSELPLAVAGGGHELCSPQYVVERPSFPYYSVELVVRGRGWLSLDGIGHELTVGTVFSYGPGVDHRIRTDPHGLLEKYFVDFTGPRAISILRDCGLPPGSAARVSSVGEVRDIFENLIRDGLRNTATANVLCAVLSEYLLIKLAELITPPGARPSPASATFQRCQQYIAAHFRRLRSLEQIADECDLDQAYLCRLFRRFGHAAPYQYLLRLKMNFAAEQLRDPKVLVKEVAANVGFQDPFHFSHAFKNVFGTSPDVFRRLRS